MLRCASPLNGKLNKKMPGFSRESSIQFSSTACVLLATRAAILGWLLRRLDRDVLRRAVDLGQDLRHNRRGFGFRFGDFTSGGVSHAKLLQLNLLAVVRIAGEFTNLAFFVPAFPFVDLHAGDVLAFHHLHAVGMPPDKLTVLLAVNVIAFELLLTVRVPPGEVARRLIEFERAFHLLVTILVPPAPGAVALVLAFAGDNGKGCNPFPEIEVRFDDLFN